jgi:orotidine-5'-phosphate decarboxylase
MNKHFTDQLAEAVRQRGNAVCVGLDPRWEQLPWPITIGREDAPNGRVEAYLDFCCGVVDVVASLVPVVKPQAAFFEELGPAGMAALAELIRYAQDRGLLVILDAKRNDIGSTAEAYARGMLGRGQSPWGADALTVSPYLGEDSLTPFVDVATQRGAGLFVLVKTSNPGSGLLQDLETVAGYENASAEAEPASNGAPRPTRGRRVYNRVAVLVERFATETAGKCGYGLAGAVVGATYPEQLAELRAAMPHTWFLVPGFGSQGGAAKDVMAAFDGQGLGAIINNSRHLIFAHARPEFERFGPQQWQRAVEAATRDMIEQLSPP